MVVYCCKVYQEIGIKHGGAAAIFPKKLGLLDEAAHCTSMAFLE
jgi:hypothetical protein